MIDYSEINKGARFWPQEGAEDLPAVRIADGPLVFVYIREIDGKPTLCVTVDTEELGDWPTEAVSLRLNVNSGRVYEGVIE